MNKSNQINWMCAFKWNPKSNIKKSNILCNLACVTEFATFSQIKENLPVYFCQPESQRCRVWRPADSWGAPACLCSCTLLVCCRSRRRSSRAARALCRWWGPHRRASPPRCRTDPAARLPSSALYAAWMLRLWSAVSRQTNEPALLWSPRV